MSFDPRADAKPLILFRAECHENTSFRKDYICARKTVYDNAPSRQEFDDHLSWQRKPTRFLSFFSSWRRVMARREHLKHNNKMDIVVIAVWAEDLAGVYSAEKAASMLGYSDTGPDPRRLRNHHDEYLVEGGIAPDEYRILAIFRGDGLEQREVTFRHSFYTISTTIPSKFFPGRRSTDALRDIEDEIFAHTGVRDDRKRDELVKAISGVSHNFPPIQYGTSASVCGLCFK